MTTSMKLHHIVISICALLCLAFAGEVHGHGSLPQKYWEAVWPNTPIPIAMQDLLKPEHEGDEIEDLPMEFEKQQYPEDLFFQNELYPGNTMNLQFDKSPFAQPAGLIKYLGANDDIKNTEKEAYNVDELCVKKRATIGEQKHCAKSLGSLIEFAISKLGNNIQALSSSLIDNQEQYTVESVQNLGDKGVMCHRLNFQKVVYYCHRIRATTAFMVPLVAGDGTKTQAIAVCHADTSGMNQQMLHDALKLDSADIKYPVCHFLGNKAIMWVPNFLGNVDV
ncbi:putative BURP domain-containing protein [Medicago truncatula]|uniref:Embryonic abundant-like protein n=1 Tax=Medicago truncatula TaxID=3880 RepID=G7ITL5_MEDTR|nr:unknown seed protein USP [Medicago truncatula]AES66791.1 embryonic abundant-like protein [Medicago truncatula]RHN75232.1 putative BURP domain-containing protein [Medicago truncatula]